MDKKSIVPTVSLVNGNPATTSIVIAECFGKRHDAVLRDIRNLVEGCPADFNGHNFVEVDYVDAKGERRSMYNVFFDGFILLVMGYTGKKALAMKLAYIASFNAMRDKLAARQAQKAVSVQQAALPARDKYESYMEEVEAFRAVTMNGIGRLIKNGLGLMDVYKFGPAPFTPYNEILLRWLMEVVFYPSALFDSGWRNIEYAIEHSPIGMIRELEKMLPDMRKRN